MDSLKSDKDYKLERSLSTRSWRKMRKSILVVLLVIMSMFTVVMILPETARATTLFVGGAGPGNYTMIQAAIDAASPGDTVYVYNGTYPEAPVIDKIISLVGENWDNTTIDTIAVNKPVQLTANWVNISGFSIKNYNRMGVSRGISLSYVQHCLVTGNKLIDTQGISLYKSSHNSISHNVFVGTWLDGVWLKFSSNNTITGNTMSATGDGVYLESSNDNIITLNDISGSGYPSMGVRLYGSDGNMVAGNNVSSNYYGISLYYAANNTVTDNNVTDNSWGIRSAHSGLNHIYHNNLIGNANQAYDDNDTNEWDDGYPSGGNHWDDHTGMDLYGGPNQDQPGADGFVDIARNIEGGQARDRHPFRSRYPLTPPTAPRNLQAFPRNGGALLWWSPPVRDGGFPVTNYVLYRGTQEGQEAFFLELGNVLEFKDKTTTGGETYYYRMSAKNALGEGPQSEGANLTVSPPPPNSPPTCTISSLVPGMSVRGTIIITGFAQDYDGIVEWVEIELDDGPWIRANGTATWVYGWDTGTVADGDHTIHARSYDGEDHSIETSVLVVVDNVFPPAHPEEEDIVDHAWTWVAIVVVALFIAATLILEWRGKKKEPEE